MKIELTSTSPISFSYIREGQKLRVKHIPKKPNEYREKIGPPSDCYLIFKGTTKIGMIPSTLTNNHDFQQSKFCTVLEINKEKKQIIVEINSTSVI
jgi:hypothetical protein